MTSIQTIIRISDANMGDTITWYERGRPQKARVQHVAHKEGLTYVFAQGKALSVEFDSGFEVTVHRDIIAEPQEFGERVNIAGTGLEAEAVRTASKFYPWACSNGGHYTWAGLNELGSVTLPEPETTAKEWWAWDQVPENTPISDRAGSVRKKLCGEILFRGDNEWQPTTVLPCELNNYVPFTEVTE